MSIRIRQEISADGTAVNTVSVPVNVLAGSVLHVWTQCDDTHTSTVADNVNGTYGAALDTVVDTTNHDTITQFRFENSASGAIVVTATSTGSATCGIWVVEIIGAKTSGALDGHTGQLQASPSTGADAVVSGTASSANQPALVIGLSYNTTNPVPPATGTGFNSSNILKLTGEGRSEYKNVAATGNQQSTFTATNGTDRYITMVATYDDGTPTITTYPQNVTTCSGTTATFTVAATASAGSLSYQWKANGSNVGTNSTSYTTGTLTSSDNGTIITCVVTDTNGNTTTPNALLTVKTCPSLAWY